MKLIVIMIPINLFIIRFEIWIHLNEKKIIVQKFSNSKQSTYLLLSVSLFCLYIYATLFIYYWHKHLLLFNFLFYYKQLIHIIWLQWLTTIGTMSDYKQTMHYPSIIFSFKLNYCICFYLLSIFNFKSSAWSVNFFSSSLYYLISRSILGLKSVL